MSKEEDRALRTFGAAAGAALFGASMFGPVGGLIGGVIGAISGSAISEEEGDSNDSKEKDS